MISYMNNEISCYIDLFDTLFYFLILFEYLNEYLCIRILIKFSYNH